MKHVRTIAMMAAVCMMSAGWVRAEANEQPSAVLPALTGAAKFSKAQFDALLSKMDVLAELIEDREPASAKAIRAAVAKARRESISENMGDVVDLLAKSLQGAYVKEGAVAQALDDVLAILRGEREPRTKDIDLIKKWIKEIRDLAGKESDLIRHGDTPLGQRQDKRRLDGVAPEIAVVDLGVTAVQHDPEDSPRRLRLGPLPLSISDHRADQRFDGGGAHSQDQFQRFVLVARGDQTSVEYGDFARTLVDVDGRIGRRQPVCRSHAAGVAQAAKRQACGGGRRVGLDQRRQGLDSPPVADSPQSFGRTCLDPMVVIPESVDQRRHGWWTQSDKLVSDSSGVKRGARPKVESPPHAGEPAVVRRTKFVQETSGLRRRGIPIDDKPDR